MRTLQRSLVTALLFLIATGAYAQQSVAIGTTTPDASAVLLLVGDGKQGLIIPKTGAIGSMPVKEGMVVYSTTDKKIYYSDGSNWTSLGGTGGGATPVLSINGNQVSIFSGTNVNLAGTPPTTVGQLFM